MSNCPNMGVDFENGWTFKDICYKNDEDSPSLNIAHYREILDHFADNLLDIKLTILKNAMLLLFLIIHS